MVPELLAVDDVAESARQVAAKKRDSTACRMALETIHEGLCVQMLHVGPYSEEPASIQAIKSFMDARRFVRNGRHHEVNLGHPRRTAPERLRTIRRQPVAHRSEG